MRAQTVDFERGLDPKDSLDIGDRDAREFRKALREKDYFAPVLENMIRGLTNGAISQSDAVQFVDHAITEYCSISNRFWESMYEEDSQVFWSTDTDEFIITFDIPDADFFGNPQHRKLRCKILESRSPQSESGIIYEIESFIQFQTPGDQKIDEAFHKHNVFILGDGDFTMKWVVQSISYSIETAIKETG